MQALLDHLAATLLALALAVLLIAAHLRSQRTSIESSAVYDAKRKTLDYAQVLSRELTSLGAGMPAAQRIDSIYTDPEGNTTYLEFWRKDLKGDTLQVRYVLEATERISDSDGSPMQLYRVRRYSRTPPAAYTPSGESPPTLEHFTVQLLDASGNPAEANVRAARQLRVRLTNVLPFGNPGDYTLSRTYWGTVLRPPALLG